MEDIPQYIYRLIPTGFPSVDEEVWIFEVEFGNPFYGDFKMGKRFLQYILENSFCTRCMDVIRDVAHLKTCPYPSKTKAEWSSSNDRMCYFPTAKLEEFRKLWDLEKARFRSSVRRSKLEKIPLPPEGIRLRLKAKQENRCYYCFSEFKTNSQKLKPHLDHFVSVANGGTNSIFNLVYACGGCNREKCSENGEQFIKTSSIPAIERLVMMEGLLKDHHRAMPELDSPEHGAWAYESMRLLQRKEPIERESKKMPIGLCPSDIRRNITKMRKSVGEWKEQFKAENLSHVEHLRKEHYRKMPNTKTPEFNQWIDEESELLLRWECIRGEIY